MTLYTAEATTKPVMDGQFGELRRILDIVPGTMLLEDPDEPTLVFPVDASTPLEAVRFVEGVAKLTGLEIVRARLRDSDR